MWGDPGLYCSPCLCLQIFWGRELAPLAFSPPGIIGDWKNHFTVAQNERFNQHYQMHMMCSDLHFQIEA